MVRRRRSGPPRHEVLKVVTNFASGTLVVLGAVIAVLGFILAGRIEMVLIGLLAVFLGGVLSLAGRRQGG